MRLGFSKSFMGIRVGFSHSSRKKKITQRELNLLQDQEFLNRISAEYASILNSFLLGNGINPKKAEKAKKSWEDLFPQSHPLHLASLEMSKHSSEISQIMEKISFGAPLNASKKDQLIDSLFKMRSTVSDSGIDLIEQRQNNRPQFSFKSIFVIAAIFSIPIWLQNQKFGVETVVMPVIMAMTVYIPYYVLKAIYFKIVK